MHLWLSTAQSSKFIWCYRSEVVDPVASSQLHILFPYFLYNHDCEVFYGVSRKVLKWEATGFSIFLVLMSDLVAIVANVQGVLCLTAYRTSCT